MCNAEYRWTKPKMVDFLRHLSLTGSVAKSARHVGMSRQSAYLLRTRMGAAFAELWDQAIVLARGQVDAWPRS